MADQALVNAIEDFKAAQFSTAAVGLDPCPVYAKVKPIITALLPFLKLIPVYGGTIVEALTLLMAALDKLCPAPAAARA
ncbi:MAG TPA: hypothetical protein VKB38_14830 [Terracidiphilus sp.]|nr:hypothetical protein [Terracidiphilus sp.]